MKNSLSVRLAALATATVSTLGIIAPTLAATFGQQEVEQDKFIAIAAPREGGEAHQLVVLEQQASSRACWSEKPGSPTIVDPLLLNFDFTGICGRSTDSNGYSIRAGGEDLALKYSLRTVHRNGDIVLIGAPNNRANPELEIGRAKGMTTDFAKIALNPGWRFTKRTYDGKPLGHVYLTNNLDLNALANSGTGNTGNTGGNTGNTGGNTGNTGGNTGNTGGNPTPPKFADIANDVYAKEINAAVNLGFIAGFAEDSTFRPQGVLTREQVVSMVLESLKQVPGANINIPTSTSARPYPDVEAGRWSAAKIQWAKQNNIVSGYTDGNFRPQQPVTRAELMAIQRRAAEFGKTLRGLNPELTVKQPATQFSDTQGHWAASTISQMSSYCSVASPENEVGTKFSPNENTRRNYAAAATLRMLNCVKAETATTGASK